MENPQFRYSFPLSQQRIVKFGKALVGLMQY